MTEEAADLGSFLERARSGDNAAVGALFERVYGDLRRITHAWLREGERDALSQRRGARRCRDR